MKVLRGSPIERRFKLRHAIVLFDVGWRVVDGGASSWRSGLEVVFTPNADGVVRRVTFRLM